MVRTGGRVRSTRRDDARLVPLINIVFLLLVFFLLAGAIRPADPLHVTRPASEASARPAGGAVRLYVARDGATSVGPVGVESDEIVAALQAAWAARAAARGGVPEPREVEIHADRGLAFERLAPLLALVESAGAENVRLVTTLRDAPASR